MAKEGFRSICSIKQLSEKIKTGEVSPIHLVEISFERIMRLNPLLNAFITIIKESAYKEAQKAEKEIKQGNYIGPLHGIPFSIKDIFFVSRVICTAGSKIMSNYIPDIDATVVTKMKRAGAILVGTNNLNEFALGITGINPHYGSSKNPWNTSNISGGSSGGSAVAVATGMVPMSLGTDTGGSIRAPASLCGVVGLKPTYGRVSRYGVLALAPSMDHIGCITRSAWDAAAVLEQISGWDPLDQLSERKATSAYTKIIEQSKINKISAAIPKTYFLDDLDPQVEKVFYNFIDTLKSIGIMISEINLPNTDKYFESSRDILCAQAAEVHLEWIKTRSEDYSEDVRKQLMFGMQMSAVNYIRNMKIAKEIRKEFIKILNRDTDVLIVPTTTITAPRFDEPRVKVRDAIIDVSTCLGKNNIVFNSSGLPAVSVPAGLTRDHMPVGIQIVGPPFNEGKILSIAYNFEYQNAGLWNRTS
jgi:aspartyl-tRNA(Asn)/glutamyl-tRNA(Gln) amidotransferase subunit A